MRLNNKYIQYKYYDTEYKMSEESLYDFKYCRDVLLKLLEYRNKGVKSIEKTILIIEEEMSKIKRDYIPPTVVGELDNLNKKYKERVDDDE